MNAPSGTPSTDATATPPKMIDVASPALPCRTSLPASPPAMAQMPPMQNPTSTRAARNIGMAGDQALARFAPVKRASSPQRITRRPMRRDPMTTNGAKTAARMAGTKSAKPPMPTETFRSPVMGTRSPTGSISVVTTQKVASPTAATPAGPLRMGNTEALRDAALAGDGIVQVGAYLVADDLRAGRLVPVLEAWALPGAPVCAVYPHRRHLTPKVRVLIDDIAARWSAGAPWGHCAQPPRG